MKEAHEWIQSGVTLVELVVVISIMITLLGIATMGLSGAQQRASLDAAAQTIISDMKAQQIKAMIGDTEGRSDPDSYGMHFDANQYVLFHGAVYSSSDAANFVVSLSSNLKIESPGFNVIFFKTSGELMAPIIVDLRDTSGNRLKRIHLSQLGVITQVESL